MNYSNIIETIIQEQADLHQSGYVPIEIVFDRDRDRYLLIQVGWTNGHWVYGCLLHLDIIEGKVYIQQNNTEVAIASRLVELGIPKHDIVLGFQSPFKRQLGEYAAS